MFSLTHGLFQCVISNASFCNNCNNKLNCCGNFFLSWTDFMCCHLLKTENHKLSNYVVSSPHDLIWSVASNCSFMNYCNHKSSIYVPFIMNPCYVSHESTSLSKGFGHAWHFFLASWTATICCFKLGIFSDFSCRFLNSNTGGPPLVRSPLVRFPLVRILLL